MLQFTQGQSWSGGFDDEALKAESDILSITVNERLLDLFKTIFLYNQPTHFLRHVFHVAYGLNMMSYAVH